MADEELRDSQVEEVAKELTAEPDEDEPPKRPYIDGDFIVIPIGVEGDVLDHYEVKLAYCRTPEQILRWVLDLGAKSWMTVEILCDFVALAAHHHDIRIYPL